MKETFPMGEVVGDDHRAAKERERVFRCTAKETRRQRGIKSYSTFAQSSYTNRATILHLFYIYFLRQVLVYSSSCPQTHSLHALAS